MKKLLLISVLALLVAVALISADLLKIGSTSVPANKSSSKKDLTSGGNSSHEISSVRSESQSEAAVTKKSLNSQRTSAVSTGNIIEDREPVDIDVADKDEYEEHESSALHRKKEKLGLISEREKRIEGEDKSDNPNMFREYQLGIRTKDGELKPGYEYNYKLKEHARYASSSKSFNKNAGLQSVTWTERGPGNVGGRTRGIVVDPDDATLNTWFAGSVGGGIWKTTNAGQTWINLTTDMPNLATSTLAMSDFNHNIMYAGTGEGFGNVDQIDGSGIWKSTDKGNTWNSLAATANNPDFQNITRIIIDPSNANIVLASATSGFYYLSSAPSSRIFRSTDGGTTWSTVYTAASGSIEHLVANPLNFNTQYATINGVGVIRSFNGGLTWHNASTGIGSVVRMEIAVAPSDTSKVYFSAEGGESGSVLYISENSGTNWYAMSDTSGDDKPWLGSQGWYDNTIAVDPYDANTVYVGGINLWKLSSVAGTDTSDEQIKKVEQNNTSSFFCIC